MKSEKEKVSPRKEGKGEHKMRGSKGQMSKKRERNETV